MQSLTMCGFFLILLYPKRNKDRIIIMKKLIILITLLLCFGVSVTLANGGELEALIPEKVNPNDGTSYTVKRIGEKFMLLTKLTSNSKVGYYKKLLARRLSELLYVIDGKDIANIEKTSQRYETTAGQLTELILKKNLTGQKESIIGLFDNHSKIIESVKEKFSYDTGERRLVQNDINSLKIYSDQLR